MNARQGTSSPLGHGLHIRVINCTQVSCLRLAGHSTSLHREAARCRASTKNRLNRRSRDRTVQVPWSYVTVDTPESAAVILTSAVPSTQPRQPPCLPLNILLFHVGIVRARAAVCIWFRLLVMSSHRTSTQPGGCYWRVGLKMQD